MLCAVRREGLSHIAQVLELMAGQTSLIREKKPKIQPLRSAGRERRIARSKYGSTTNVVQSQRGKRRLAGA